MPGSQGGLGARIHRDVINHWGANAPSLRRAPAGLPSPGHVGCVTRLCRAVRVCVYVCASE